MLSRWSCQHDGFDTHMWDVADLAYVQKNIYDMAVFTYYSCILNLTCYYNVKSGKTLFFPLFSLFWLKLIKNKSEFLSVIFSLASSCTDTPGFLFGLHV